LDCERVGLGVGGEEDVVVGEGERERKTSFGEMDRVGGTKRLFRRG